MRIRSIVAPAAKPAIPRASRDPMECGGPPAKPKKREGYPPFTGRMRRKSDPLPVKSALIPIGLVRSRPLVRGWGDFPRALLHLAPTQIFPQGRLQPLRAAAGIAGSVASLVILGPARHGLNIAPAPAQARSSIALLFGGRLWQFPPRSRRPPGLCANSSCRSSVVEHPLGKGEVECSIHSGSTIHSKNVRSSTVQPPAASDKPRRPGGRPTASA